MSELHHECGIVAVYHLPSNERCRISVGSPDDAARLVPRMLQDIQNRGQLSAGMSSFNPNRDQLIDTHKDLGVVSEVFRLSHKGKSESLMRDFAGRAAIGHVRYATCGKDEFGYAQPFERNHVQKHKWFAFGFNGQLANYPELRAELLADEQFHLVRDTDTEIIMHEISRQLARSTPRDLLGMWRAVSAKFDGSYCLAYLDANGDMLIARDPLGIRPLCYARSGPLFAAASETVPLLNVGFERSEIHNLPPGHAIAIVDGRVEIAPFADRCGQAHCFFEWIYFANVASSLDGISVYQARTRLGVELARLEEMKGGLDVHDGNTIIVPVPDTSKAAADSMAYELGIPSREGLIRNRYSGRTFIEQNAEQRRQRANAKYTPLREVLEGKRVILVEDSIVRSTTMKTLLHRIYAEGGAAEVHVRVACPPIIAPCFYGIDMSTVGELFAPKYLRGAIEPSAEIQEEMARDLGCDSLRYLPVAAISRAVGLRSDQLCQACITGRYPTFAGQRLYQFAQANAANGRTGDSRTYESLRVNQ
jgi:amidophosphoribosyltransferase